MLAQRIAVLADAGDGCSDGAGDADPRSLGRRGGASGPPAEAERAGEFRDEEVELLRELSQAAAVFGLCPRVDDLSGVAGPRGNESGLDDTVGPVVRSFTGNE